MKTRRRNYSDDPLTISRCNTRAKKTETSEDSIPIDLILEILSRLPAKSVAKCRCVSNLWASILRRPDFTELFLTRSRSHPQLLFACRKQGEFLFLSSPQPQNPDVDSSSPVVRAVQLMNLTFNDSPCEISGPVHGLVCLHKRLSKGFRKEPVICCNLSTGQSLTLPKVKTRRVGVDSYLGYVPIDKQFKLLCMTCTGNGRHRVFDEYQILTIGTEKKNMSWRMIKCCIPPHHSYHKGICIDGVLYYKAAEDNSSQLSMIVCFDFRSEKFSFITIPEDSIRLVGNGYLVNYNGKLGLVVCDRYRIVNGRNGTSGSFELWVLEDVENNVWSKHTYVLPAMWQDILGYDYLYLVGMTRMNEIVFKPTIRMPTFCVVYYNIERNTITKVGIQGMEAFEHSHSVNVDLYLDHVEEVKLM